jgi:hypothetical protein
MKHAFLWTSMVENFLDIESGEPHKDTVQVVHGLVLRYCVHYNLPNLLDIYLDHHSLAADNTSMSLMRAVVGGFQWAQWLLLSRIKGCEYEASFFNARLNISRNVTPGRNLGVPEMEGLIPTVDDIAEGGEMGSKLRKARDAVGLHLCILVPAELNERPTLNETVSTRSSSSNTALLGGACESTLGPVQSSQVSPGRLHLIKPSV